jgi:hypothetical protein
MSVNVSISGVHKKHHEDACQCVKSTAAASQRLLQRIKALESTGRKVCCVYAVGTDVSKKVVTNTDFGERNLSVVFSRHPTSALYDSAEAFDSKMGTFDFFFFKIRKHSPRNSSSQWL